MDLVTVLGPRRKMAEPAFPIPYLSFLVCSLAISIRATAASSTQEPILPDLHHQPFLSGSSTARLGNWTALGDSYAAGLGCGFPIGSDCGRFNLSYPLQLQSSSGLARLPPSGLNLQACSGAFMPGVLHDQIPHLGPQSTTSFATLTVSGNDVGFPAVLNACIYRFSGWPGSGVCGDEIRRTQDLIDGLALGESMRDILGNATATANGNGNGNGAEQQDEEVPTTTRSRSRPRFHLFVTGYAAFFNEDTLPCDAVSFKRCVAPAPLCWLDTVSSPSSTILTKKLRRDLNRLVTNLNARLAGIVADFCRDAGGEDAPVTFVDYNKDFDGHRFCEAGVAEPDNSEAARSWFYNVDRVDGGLSRVDDRQRLERALHPTAGGHGMIARKVAAAILRHYGLDARHEG